MTRDKQKHLEKCAEEFLAALRKYSVEDADVERLLEFFVPWYEKVKRGEVIPPCYDYKLDVYFTNPDISPIAAKYHYATDGRHELNVAAAHFWAAIYDRLSSEDGPESIDRA